MFAICSVGSGELSIQEGLATEGRLADCSSNTHGLPGYHSRLRETALQQMVSADVSHVHHLDWLAVLPGGLDDYNRG